MELKNYDLTDYINNNLGRLEMSIEYIQNDKELREHLLAHDALTTDEYLNQQVGKGFDKSELERRYSTTTPEGIEEIDNIVRAFNEKKKLQTVDEIVKSFKTMKKNVIKIANDSICGKQHGLSKDNPFV